MKEKYTVIIVDDEYLAQKLLQDYVSKVESLRLVATCSNAFEAMDALKNNKVDIMLLDIQMPDLTGLELVRSLENKPAVIFTTAYSEYAVDAFNLAVSDYLPKPFNFPRFFQAINKAVVSIFLSLLRQLIFLLPFLWFLPRMLSINGVWWSMPAADFCAAAVTAVVMAFATRKLVRHSYPSQIETPTTSIY